MILTIGTVILVVLAAGCEEETVAPEKIVREVDALTIIVRPLAPATGGSATLSVQATGTSDILADYRWIVDAGSLMVDEGPSVIWNVPDESGIYRVEVRASLDESADTLEKYVMVRNFETIDWTFGGLSGEVTESYFPYYDEIRGLFSFSYGDDWYNGPIWGYHVLKNSAGVVSCATCATKDADRPSFGGDYFTINGAQNKILGSLYNTSSGYYRQQRMNIWLFPLVGIIDDPINVTRSDVSDESDDPMIVKNRKNQHVYPYGSSNMDMIVWQQHITGLRQDGTDDEFNIGFSNASRWNTSWSEGQPPTFMTLTQSYYIKIQTIGGLQDTSRVYYKNIRPILTPQDDNVIYFVDSTGTFEPCLVPIVGTEPDTLQRRALMLGPGADHGIFWLEGIEVQENTVFQWNPTSNLLGFIDARGFLCFFDYVSETATRLTNIGKIDEFSWSPDGEKVAVTHEIGVSIVNIAGSDRSVFIKEEASDELFGVNWSHDSDDPRIAFRVVRKGRDEFESFSAIVVYSDRNDRWYYATPALRWFSEPDVSDYRWLRVLFEQDDSGIYAPIPVADVQGKDVGMYHSFK